MRKRLSFIMLIANCYFLNGCIEDVFDPQNTDECTTYLWDQGLDPNSDEWWEAYTICRLQFSGDNR